MCPIPVFVAFLHNSFHGLISIFSFLLPIVCRLNESRNLVLLTAVSTDPKPVLGTY